MTFKTQNIISFLLYCVLSQLNYYRTFGVLIYDRVLSTKKNYENLYAMCMCYTYI